MAWKLWGRGLIAAFVSSASSGLAAWTVDPADFNFDTPLKMLKLCVVAGLIGAGLYLKQHPLPDDSNVVTGGR